ncbi:MAG: CYTH domain-containing protein [Bacteroidales bacterium]|jgi:CYTH domain-containing protein|nr:CYTH domain-containing protein [Bacteroidales bacterium]
MPIEIERKFLVSGDFMTEATEATEIVQGYLSRSPDRTVRIRIRGEKGFITIKGRAGEEQNARYEWEKEISVEDARELLNLCEPFPVIKTRYLIPFGNHVFEVDVFHRENEGLVMAEVELRAVGEEFEKPPWLGKEVTSDPRYFNSALSTNPFKKW